MDLEAFRHLESAGKVGIVSEVPPVRSVQVSAYAGSRGEEEPRRLEVGGRELAVVEIVDRWQEPHGRFFRVRTGDGETHLLLCREADGTWWLVTR